MCLHLLKLKNLRRRITRFMLKMYNMNNLDWIYFQQQGSQYIALWLQK